MFVEAGSRLERPVEGRPFHYVLSRFTHFFFSSLRTLLREALLIWSFALEDEALSVR